MIKRTSHILRKKFCPRQRSCPGQVACSKKVILGETVLPQAAKLPQTSGLFKKKTDFSEKQSAPGSAAASDKWLGREKANNRCSQGRGAPFWGSGGRSPPESRGVRGGAAPPPPAPQIPAKIIVKLPINRPGGRYINAILRTALLFCSRHSEPSSCFSGSHPSGRRQAQPTCAEQSQDSPPQGEGRRGRARPTRS